MNTFDALLTPLAVDEPSYPLPACVHSSIRDAFPEIRGGYTKDQIFHVFGQSEHAYHSAEQWNAHDLWKQYTPLSENDWVFAESVTGEQFYFKDGTSVIHSYDPASGRCESESNRLDLFISDYLRDELDTARYYESIASQFRVHNTLPYGHHVSPKVHPALGGSTGNPQDYELTDSVTNICLMAQINYQVARLPEGTQITRVEYDPNSRTAKLIVD